MSMTSSLGRVAYEAYRRSTGNQTFDGRNMLDWEDLGENIQRAWEMAAQAIADLSNSLNPGPRGRERSW